MFEWTNCGVNLLSHASNGEQTTVHGTYRSQVTSARTRPPTPPKRTSSARRIEITGESASSTSLVDADHAEPVWRAHARTCTTSELVPRTMKKLSGTLDSPEYDNASADEVIRASRQWVQYLSKYGGVEQGRSTDPESGSTFFQRPPQSPVEPDRLVRPRVD